MAELQSPAPSKHGGTWWRVLLIGLVAYPLSIVLLVLTGNPNLFPTVMMVGNFVVPVAYVFFFYERRHLSSITLGTILLTFLWGGLLGVFAASVLEPIIIHGRDVGNAFLVGMVEEVAKVLGVLVIVRRRRHDSEMDGLLLGATAGMGFAALENMGYAFSAFLASGGSLSATVGITLVRGVLSPVGHGTWTALLVSVMAREATPQRFRINLAVLGAYLLVVVLHGLWNSLPIVTAVVLGQGPQMLVPQLLVGAVGIALLWRRWREARRRQEQPMLRPSDGQPEAAHRAPQG